MADDDLPRQLAKWSLRRVLGSGATGTVYLAYDTTTSSADSSEMPIALKVMSDRDDPVIDKRIHAGVARVRALKHMNCMSVYSAEHVDGRWCIAMEYLNGETLQSVIDREGALSPEDVVDLVAQVGAGVIHAHESKLFHLDLKPSNVMLVQSEGHYVAKIIDYGLTVYKAQTLKVGFGTVPYASPEQLLGENVDERSDVHALAVMTYKMLGGEWPPWSHNRSGDDELREISWLPAGGMETLQCGASYSRDGRCETIAEFVDGIRAAFEPTLDASVESRLVGSTVQVSGAMTFPEFDGVCLLCNKNHGAYSIGSRDRYCCTGDLSTDDARAFASLIEQRLVPTIFPVPKAESDGRLVIPSSPFSQTPDDGFVIAGDVSPTNTSSEPQDTLPVSSALLWPKWLNCGNATIHELGPTSTQFGFESGSVLICDMSSYPWSGTLKDPRSVAIVRTAVEHSVRHLGAWTAGNAGVSLARMVHAVNLQLPREKRISVYCFNRQESEIVLRKSAKKKGKKGKAQRQGGERKRGSLPTEVVGAIERVRGHVLLLKEPAEGIVFSPELTLDVVNHQTELALSFREYWDVSDGWEGVGTYMYRLLARQLIQYVRPKFIVAPVGTGNLLYGLYLGVADAIRRGMITEGECQVVGAVPASRSVVNNLEKIGVRVPVSGDRDGETPVADKLLTVYTPLLLVLYHALQEEGGRVRLIAVDRQCQAEALKALVSKHGNQAVAAEPSAVLAFAGLMCLGEDLQARNRQFGAAASEESVRLVKDRVVVINSGCGAVGKREAKFVATSRSREQ